MILRGRRKHTGPSLLPEAAPGGNRSGPSFHTGWNAIGEANCDGRVSEPEMLGQGVRDFRMRRHTNQDNSDWRPSLAVGQNYRIKLTAGHCGSQ
jgi:hypothetical protein